MIKRLLLSILLSIVACLAFLPQHDVSAGTWTMSTNAADLISPFNARLNGEASPSGVTTAQSGFVMDTVSHGDPGTTAPAASDYDYYYTASDVHSGFFTWDYDAKSLLDPLIASTEYYFRACVYFGAPNNTWDYGDELNFTTGDTPAEDADIDTFAASSVTSTTALLNGQIIGADALNAWGFAWDNVSYSNPSGWPLDWNEVPISASSYTNYGTTVFANIDGTYSLPVTGLTPNTVYYYRAAKDLSVGGDWRWGPEENFTTDAGACTLHDYSNGLPPYDPPDTTSETIGGNDQSFQSLLATDTYNVTHVNLLLYRVGNPTTLTVTFYNENSTTYVPEGPELGHGHADVSGITTDTSGEWVTVELDSTVNLVNTYWYDMVLSQPATGANDIVWLTTTNGNGFYAFSNDGGATWAYDPDPGPYRDDGLYELWECAGATTSDAMYEVWGSLPGGWESGLVKLLLLSLIALWIFAMLIVWRSGSRENEL